MKQTDTDLRIVKTRRQIREAFLALLNEKSFEEITVSQISRAAMISRSTFYDHYTDKYALVKAIYEDVRVQLEQIAEAAFSNQTADARMELSIQILSYVLENARLFRVLLANPTSTRTLFAILQETIEPRCLAYLECHQNHFQLDNRFVVQLYSGIVYQSLQWVAEHEDPMDLQKIVNLSSQVLTMFFD